MLIGVLLVLSHHHQLLQRVGMGTRGGVKTEKTNRDTGRQQLRRQLGTSMCAKLLHGRHCPAELRTMRE